MRSLAGAQAGTARSQQGDQKWQGDQPVNDLVVGRVDDAAMRVAVQHDLRLVNRHRAAGAVATLLAIASEQPVNAPAGADSVRVPVRHWHNAVEPTLEPRSHGHCGVALGSVG